MRTYIYIDGFNFYYNSVKNTPYKWLNFSAFCKSLLPKSQIQRINYYTAKVKSHPHDMDAGKRQREFLRALETLLDLNIFYGHFSSWPKNMPLYDSVVYDDIEIQNLLPRQYSQCSKMRKKIVTVWDTKEKGSDVNLASHLIRDAYNRAFETACVFSNDSDLVEPIRIVKQIGFPINVWLKEHTPPSAQLKNVASIYYYKNTDLKTNQFPSTFNDAKGRPITKPTSWN